MRCFVAVDIPDKIKSNILNLQKNLPVTGLRLVAPENMHFTLKFFGECNDDEILHIKKTLSTVSESHKPIVASVAGSGAFPSLKYIKVIWVGCPALIELMKSIQSTFPGHEKEAIPHLTLARVGYGADYVALADFVKAHEHYEAGSMNINEIKLKSSVLGRSGPVYNNLSVHRLSA